MNMQICSTTVVLDHVRGRENYHDGGLVNRLRSIAIIDNVLPNSVLIVIEII